MPSAAANERKWLQDVERALDFARMHVGTDVVSTRNALFALWQVVDKAPARVRDIFRRFDESALVQDAVALKTKDLFANVPLAIGTVDQRTKLLYALAIHVRNVEDLLHEAAGEQPIRNERQCLATYENEGAYLLLRNPRHRTAKTKQPFRRRGLRRSRIFPRQIGDYRVKPLFFEDPRARDRAGAQRELSFGAGLFEELEFVLDHDPGGFFVTGIKAKDQLGAIRSDLEMASGSGCDGIVYPELTITGDTLGEIRKKVGAGEWRSDLSFVIAGSRHEMVDKQRFNICSILNGYGGEIGEHRKLFQYTDGTNDAESIELGTELPLLILPDATIAFGICLDYCNISEDPPYADLDVDYVLVPSCGNEKTMEGHVKRSAQYMDVHKTRTLVVQQFFDEKIPKDPPLGYVLCRRDDAALGALDTETRHRWGIYNL